MKAVTLKRFDTISIPKVSKTQDGYLRGEVIASRAGVFKYLNSDGSVRKELRHPDDVLRADSLSTISMIPVTDDHPKEFVNSKNASKYQVGYTGESYRVDNNNIITSITVTHQDVIDKILNGLKVELSLGYDVTLIKESGNFDGEDYDYRQTAITYNHLAVVERGRAGSVARFRFDGAAELYNDNNKITKEDFMSDEKKYDSANFDAEIKIRDSRIDALIAEKTVVIKELEAKTLKLDAMESSLLSLKKDNELLEMERSDSVIADKVKERFALFALAQPFLKEQWSAFLHHSNKDIMGAVLNSHSDEQEDFSNVSEEYVRGRFDSLVGVASINRVDGAAVLHAINNDLGNHGNSTHDKISKRLKEGK